MKISAVVHSTRRRMSSFHLFSFCLPLLMLGCGGDDTPAGNATGAAAGTAGTAGSSSPGGSAGSAGSNAGSAGSAATQGTSGVGGTSGGGGSNGTSGTGGTSGTSGAAGANGGSAGEGGTSGSSGGSGANGANGTGGTSATGGTAGAAGTGGASGASGASGTSGTNGTNGSSGSSGASGAGTGVCASPYPLAVGSTPGTTIGGQSQLSAVDGPYCADGDGEGPEQVYVFTPAVDGLLEVQANYDSSPFGYVTLYLRSACADASSQLDCDTESSGYATTGAHAGVPVYVIVDTQDGGSVGGTYTLLTTFTPSDCGNGTIELPETCDDGNLVAGDGCTACHYDPEHQCQNLKDEDLDGLVDCQDPDCHTGSQCTPGAGVVGSACTLNSNCASVAGNDPLCLDELHTGFPGGSCSEFCDLNADDCPAGSVCDPYYIEGLPDPLGVCRKACFATTDCRPGYTCDTNGGGVCSPQCSSDSQCSTTHHCTVNGSSPGYCSTPENCSDGVDNDADGFVDCADFEQDQTCSTTPACVTAINAECASAIALSETIYHGTTVGAPRNMQPHNVFFTCSFSSETTGTGGERIFSYVAPAAGTVEFLFSSSHSLVAYNRNTTCGTPASNEACEQIYDPATPGQISTDVTANQKVYFVLDSTTVQDEGEFDVHAHFYSTGCGDGQIGSGEQCDDSNTDSLDGCSSTCQVECPSTTIPIMPGNNTGNTQNGTSVLKETVSASAGCTNVDGAGKEVIYTFTPSSSNTYTVTLTTSAALTVYVRESCAHGLGMTACETNVSQTTHTTSFYGQAGRQMLIVVDTPVAGDEGAFTIKVQ